MTGELLEELCPLLTKIVRENEWKILKEERSTSFGNALVELDSGDFITRVVRDRGTVSIDLCAEKQRKWTDLETVLIFIGETVSSRDQEILLRLLKKNLGKVEALMSSNTDQLETFEKQRNSEFITRIFPPSGPR